MLHLFAGALARRQPLNEPLRPIPAIYISVPSPFPVLEDFIEEDAKAYNLDLFTVRPPDEILPVLPEAISALAGTSQQQEPTTNKGKGVDGMKKALEVYKNTFPNISAILIGTRRSDPHGGMLVIRAR